MSHILTPSSKADRWLTLDWLRALAILTVVYYHGALVYAGGSWQWVVSDPAGHPLLGPVLIGLSAWRMPLMFWIAGASTYFLMRSRPLGRFTRERVRRLGVPLVVCLVTVVPLERFLSDPQPLLEADSWSELLRAGWVAVFTPVPTFYHLWFLHYLLLITGAVAATYALPGSARWRSALRLRFEAVALRPRGLFMVGAAPATIALLPIPWPLTGAWHVGVNVRDLLCCGVFFAVGGLIAATPSVRAALPAHRRASLAGFAVATGLLTGALAWRELSGGVAALPAWAAVALRGTTMLSAWLGILTAVGYGEAHLTSRSPLLAYLREASFTLYLLHECVIVALARWLLPWSTSPALKYLVVAHGALLVSVLLFEVVVRRSQLLCFAFGVSAGRAPTLATLLPPPLAPLRRALRAPVDGVLRERTRARARDAVHLGPAHERPRAPGVRVGDVPASLAVAESVRIREATRSLPRAPHS